MKTRRPCRALNPDITHEEACGEADLDEPVLAMGGSDIGSGIARCAECDRFAECRCEGARAGDIGCLEFLPVGFFTTR
jgi:hypothetical protein